MRLALIGFVCLVTVWLSSQWWPPESSGLINTDRLILPFPSCRSCWKHEDLIGAVANSTQQFFFLFSPFLYIYTVHISYQDVFLVPCWEVVPNYTRNPPAASVLLVSHLPTHQSANSVNIVAILHIFSDELLNNDCWNCVIWAHHCVCYEPKPMYRRKAGFFSIVHKLRLK